MKKSYFVALVLSLIVLIGCTPGEGDVTVPESPYEGGSQGLVVEIQDLGVYNEKANTQEVFEGEPIPLEVTLKNKGEYEVQADEAKVELLGIFPADFSNLSATELANTESIEKVSEYNKDGGEVTIAFHTDNGVVYTPDLGDASSRDLSFFARATYRYKTLASVPKVCFKSDLQDKTVCDVDEVKDVFSSGAPIQVTKAEEKRAGAGAIAVEFDVENVAGAESAVPEDVFDSRYNQFKFTADDAIWTCTSRGSTDSGRFDSNGKAKIRCKADVPDGALYTRQLGLTLEYDYRQIGHKQVRVLHE